MTLSEFGDAVPCPLEECVHALRAEARELRQLVDKGTPVPTPMLLELFAAGFDLCAAMDELKQRECV